MITQEVLEHIHRPERAFAEIRRVLRPKGLHVFTVPYDGSQASVRRTEITPDGEIRYLLPPEYHGDPLSPAGILVATDWGMDLPQFIEASCGMTTDVLSISDVHQGIPDPITIFVSRLQSS